MSTGSKSVLGTLWFGLFAVIVGCHAEPINTAVTQKKPAGSVPASTQIVAEVKQDLIARHLQEDRLWADRAHLTMEQVRQLRNMAEVADDEAAFIDNLDTQNLKKDNHILLVTSSGNGHCLELSVFEPKGESFQRVWSTDETPTGAGFCRESPKNPEAFASNGKITVKVPVFDYNKGTDKSVDIYVYSWNGHRYDFTGKNLGV